MIQSLMVLLALLGIAVGNESPVDLTVDDRAWLRSIHVKV